MSDLRTAFKQRFRHKKQEIVASKSTDEMLRIAKRTFDIANFDEPLTSSSSADRDTRSPVMT